MTSTVRPSLSEVLLQALANSRKLRRTHPHLRRRLIITIISILRIFLSYDYTDDF